MEKADAQGVLFIILLMFILNPRTCSLLCKCFFLMKDWKIVLFYNQIE